MADETGSKKKTKDLDGETTDPVQVIRHGAIAASVWKRQSPSGFAYYDFTLSRSWKSLGTGKAGYSKSFFGANEAELVEVIQKASAWIASQPQGQASQQADGNPTGL